MFTAPLPFLLGWLFGLLSLTLLGGGLLILYAWYVGELVRSRVKRASRSRRATHVGLSGRGFEICIDGLSFWLMRIAREIGRGTSVQALWERRACQERADAQQAALPVQSLRPELH